MRYLVTLSNNVTGEFEAANITEAQAAAQAYLDALAAAFNEPAPDIISIEEQ